MARILPLYFFLLFFSFCKNSPEKSVFEKINTSEKGDFRGIFIRSSIAEVKQTEKNIPKNAEDDYLFYEIPISENEEYYTLGYSFNEKGLYEILSDIYLKKPDDALKLFQQIKENFQTRFGNPQQEDDRTVVWTIKTEKSNEVEVTLSDESENYDSGKISISFYDLAY